MQFSRPSVRVLLTVVIAAIPPLVGFAIFTQVAAAFIETVGMGTALVLASGVTLVWAIAVAVVASRLTAAEVESMLHLAERGVTNPRDEGDDALDEEMSGVQRRLAASLEERNRQIASLVALVRSTPIADEPRSVATSLVRGARELTRDPTWALAVLRADDQAGLQVGVYGVDSSAIDPIEDVHRWAATIGDAGGSPGAQTADGPWGSFALIDVTAGEVLGAVLLAPREGRPPPSPADLNLFSLLGQQAATAIEHSMLYARLRSQADELNRMSAVQSDFLRGITHDLQTPLTSIGVLASELQSSVEADEAIREDLAIIVRQADRLRRMVGQLLAVSRLEAGALQPRHDVFSATSLVKRTWDALHAPDHTLEVSAPEMPYLLVGDPDRFEQVLWAVLDNAVKYSPSGTAIRIEQAGRIDAADPQRLVAVIAIRDEGAGMDTDTVDHAFDQFYRSPEARRLAPDGSGIGLYAARGLMRAMDGDIEIQSRLGAGTTVVITALAERASDSDSSHEGHGAQISHGDAVQRG